LRERLIELAREARRKAYAPYSGYEVGAAARFAGGEIHTGCNVENASLGATRCAEQVAILTGVAGGCRRLEAVAIVTEGETPAWPCGVCRQIIYEFGPEAVVIAATVGGAVEEAPIQELLPRPFGPEALERD
jgi:cytidine deaminase